MRKRVVFIDSNVADYQVLIDGLPSDAEWFVLGAASGGLEQMASILSGYSELDAIDVISHGHVGALYLGSTVLDSSNLSSYDAQLRAIGQSLTEAGDILLYGCNVAQGDVGLQFITSLAQYTGADVAASTDLTGAAWLGGDWQLEQSTSLVESTSIAPANYQSILLAESEPNDSRTNANAIPLNTPVVGALSTYTDMDYYSVAATAAGTLSVAFDVPTNSSYSDYFKLGLYNSSGTLLSLFSTGMDKTYSVGVAAAGTYYIGVTGNDYLSGFYYNSGQYSLTASHVAGSTNGAESEANNTIATADAITLGTSIVGQLSTYTDMDYYSVAATAAGTLSVAFDVPTNSSYSDYFKLGLYNSSGTLLSLFSTGMDKTYSVGVAAAGTYYIGVTGAGSFYYSSGAYSLTVAHSAGSANGYESESNDTRATADTVTLGAAITGQITTNFDVDYYAVTVGAAGTVNLNFDRPNNLSSGYFSIKLEDASGATIGTFTDSTDPQTFTMLVTQAGTYYARVASAYSYTYSSDQYRLTASTTTDTTAPTVTSFSPADDASAVAVGSNVVLTFSEAIQRGTGTIYLKTATGTVVESFDAATSARLSFSSSTLTLDPTASLANGTGYRVEYGAGTVHDLAGNAYAGTTSYNFATVAAAISDDYAASTSTTGRLTVGSSVTGQIETTGDRDWFAVSLTAGQIYTFRLNAAATNGLSDPYLKLYNGTGTYLTYNDDSLGTLNSTISFTPATSGTYYLEAKHAGSGVGSYALNAASAPAPSTGGSGFSITVNFTGNAIYETYFTQAAQRWAEIIIGDLPDVNTNRGLIDDLLIDASIGPIDGVGSILGGAMATNFRSIGGLPFFGRMQFDVADVPSLVASGRFESVVLHEMGHVLGLSDYLWQRQGLVSGFNYIGANAVAAYDSLAAGVQTSVQLETGGGAGTARSHWSEAVFDAELMTGYIESSLPMPISIITVGALQDLGYRVNYAAADYYNI